MKSWPHPAESDGRRLRRIRRIGRKPSRMKWISGIRSFSSRLTVSWCGIPLARSAPESLDEGRHPRQGVGSQPDVGVEEDEQGMPGLLGQDPAGVLLAAPAGRQLGRGDEPDPIVAVGQLLDDRGRPVLGVIVEDDDLELEAAVLAARRGPRLRSPLPRSARGSGPRPGAAPRPGQGRAAEHTPGGWRERGAPGIRARIREIKVRVSMVIQVGILRR